MGNNCPSHVPRTRRIMCAVHITCPLSQETRSSEVRLCSIAPIKDAAKSAISSSAGAHRSAASVCQWQVACRPSPGARRRSHGTRRRSPAAAIGNASCQAANHTSNESTTDMRRRYNAVVGPERQTYSSRDRRNQGVVGQVLRHKFEDGIMKFQVHWNGYT